VTAAKPDPVPPLKLIALDTEDLAVISAHLQDAVMAVGDMAYLPRERRFAAIGNRFDWLAFAQTEKTGRPDAYRKRTALRFERVLGAKVQGIDLKNATAIFSLLAMQFEPSAEPAGTVTLVFSGGGAIRLEVECIEAELRDLGGAWAARATPRHDAPPDPKRNSS
jgi:Protein of unknown function (DUF2948)